MTQIPSEAEVLGYAEQLSNWGRWGTADELGTLNLITADRRLHAVSTVVEGLTVGCARPIVVESAADVTNQPLHYMSRLGDASKRESAATDFFGLHPHGLTISHIDALSHHFMFGTLYNGHPLASVTAEGKARVASLEIMRDGIVTKGVLLDICAVRGKPYLDAGEAIYPADLEAAEATERVRMGPGDALLIRTGWYKRRVECGAPPGKSRPGLHAATLPWLHSRDVALVASDVSHDVIPSGYDALDSPIHSIGMVAMGLCLIDACQFEDLVATCTRLGRWEFLFVVAPIRFSGVTGSPVTPIAIF